MGAVRVTTPDGTDWVVRRRWVPQRERSVVLRSLERRRLLQSERRRGDGWYHSLDLPAFGDELAAAAIVVAGVALLVVMLLFGWTLVLVGVSVVWIVLGTIVGTLARVVLRRPWWVEARSATERRDWYVRGFKAAGAHRDEIARQFRHGQNPSGNPPGALAH